MCQLKLSILVQRVNLGSTVSPSHSAPHQKYFEDLEESLTVLRSPFSSVNPFYTTGLFLYPLKASEKQRFSAVEREQLYGLGSLPFWRHEKMYGTFACNKDTLWMSRYKWNVSNKRLRHILHHSFRFGTMVKHWGTMNNVIPRLGFILFPSTHMYSSRIRLFYSFNITIILSFIYYFILTIVTIFISFIYYFILTSITIFISFIYFILTSKYLFCTCASLYWYYFVIVLIITGQHHLVKTYPNLHRTPSFWKIFSDNSYHLGKARENNTATTTL